VDCREINAISSPPNPGEHLDWILVLDDAAKGYPPPGADRSP